MTETMLPPHGGDRWEADEEFIDAMTQRLRQNESRLGHLHAAIWYKKALVERLGIEEAFRAAREHLNVPGIDRLRQRRVISLKEAAQRSAFLSELWPGGHDFHVAPPNVVGEGDHADYRGISRSAYLTCLENVTIRGRSSVVLTDREAVVDYENDELKRFADNPELDPGVLHADGGFYWTMEPTSELPLFDEAFSLCGKHTHDFGHWLTEYLPKLAIALLARLPTASVLVDQLMPATHVESLRLVIPERHIVTVPHLSACRVRRLWCASNVVYRGFYPTHWSEAWPALAPDPASFATTIRVIKGIALQTISTDTGCERVFLARRPERKKKLLNQEEIEKVARDKGFFVVYPEDFSFSEQLRIVHHARRIIAPEGSNALLAYFARPGALVCVLNSTNTLPLVELNGILAALGVGLTVLTGPMTGPETTDRFWNDYSIDKAVFCAFLDDWARSSVGLQARGAI